MLGFYFCFNNLFYFTKKENNIVTILDYDGTLCNCYQTGWIMIQVYPWTWMFMLCNPGHGKMYTEKTMKWKKLMTNVKSQFYFLLFLGPCFVVLDVIVMNGWRVSLYNYVSPRSCLSQDWIKSKMMRNSEAWFLCRCAGRDATLCWWCCIFQGAHCIHYSLVAVLCFPDCVLQWDKRVDRVCIPIIAL